MFGHLAFERAFNQATGEVFEDPACAHDLLGRLALQEIIEVLVGRIRPGHGVPPRLKSRP
jgi:hypothetical protein